MKLALKYLDAIENNDVLRLQMMLVTIIYSDEGFNTNRFTETLREIKQQCPQIIVPYNGKIVMDKTQWNEDYYNQSLAELRQNFSQERIDHVMELGRYLHGNKEVKSSVGRSSNVKTVSDMQQNYKKVASSSSTQRVSLEQSKSRTEISGKKTVATAVVVGATVAGVGAIITKSIPLMVGAVVVGGIGVYNLATQKK